MAPGNSAVKKTLCSLFTSLREAPMATAAVTLHISPELQLKAPLSTALREAAEGEEDQRRRSCGRRNPNLPQFFDIPQIEESVILTSGQPEWDTRIWENWYKSGQVRSARTTCRLLISYIPTTGGFSSKAHYFT